MSYETQEALNEVALACGATYRGKGSFRTLLNKIAKGELGIKKNTHHLDAGGLS